MSVIQTIEELIVPVLSDEGFELIETQYRREGGGWVLRLLIDHLSLGAESGKVQRITLADCQKVSRRVEEVLDPSNVIGESYALEVSSPGINRPLKTAEHFKKYEGQKVKVSLFAPRSLESSQRNFMGVIVGATDELVEVDDVVSGKVKILISAISKAHLNII